MELDCCRVTCGQHSTARPSSTRASSSLANSTAAFQSLTLVGSRSKARLRTLLWLWGSFSSSAALIHSLTEVGLAPTPFATIALASSGFDSLANSSHTSSEVGQKSQPFWISFLASASFPATSSCNSIDTSLVLFRQADGFMSLPKEISIASFSSVWRCNLMSLWLHRVKEPYWSEFLSNALLPVHKRKDALVSDLASSLICLIECHHLTA